jgi:hypothetical protein
MWNDTDTPLAFLITFRSYGTWLHGDNRGSVNRFRNKHNSPRLPPEETWIEKNTARLKGEIVTLSARQRRCVDEAIRETCMLRQWDLYAVNVRTNHAHTVVSIGTKKPASALNGFKANATRKMREKGSGKVKGVPGLIRAANDICGMREVLHVQLTTFSMDREMIHLTLTMSNCSEYEFRSASRGPSIFGNEDQPPATAGGSD